jgi:epoxyqueuosine reductase
MKGTAITINKTFWVYFRRILRMLEKIQELVRHEGMSLMGVAPVERFEGAPRGHRPRDFIPKARSVVVFGIGLLPAAVAHGDLLRDSEIFDEGLRKKVAQDYLYALTAYEIPNALLERVAMRSALMLQQAGYNSLYFPVTYGAIVRPIAEAMTDPFAPFSHRHAAVRAGLAEFGLNNLVVTPQFGPRVRFTSLISEAELAPTPLLKEKVCIGTGCATCINSCPAQAITVSKGIDEGAFWLNPPSRTNKPACQESGRARFCRGVCQKVCPVHEGRWG